jgi:hypothetical protein
VTARSDDRERRDELALVSQEAAIAAVTAVAAAELGPAGAVLAGLLGPYAALAAKRLRELIGRVEEAGFDRETIAKSLDSDEALAQMIAEAGRSSRTSRRNGDSSLALRSMRSLTMRSLTRRLGLSGPSRLTLSTSAFSRSSGSPGPSGHPHHWGGPRAAQAEYEVTSADDPARRPAPAY